MYLVPLPDDDLIGKSIGRLIVKGKFRQIYENGKTQLKYSCICNCNSNNNRIYIKREDLVHKRRLDCGCMRKGPSNKFIDRKVAMLKYQYASSIVKRSKQKKFTEMIKFEDFVSIIQQPCVFCGAIDSCTIKDRFPHEGNVNQIKCNTIDRLDNSLGYIVGNCIPCCVTCNIAKGERTLEQFLKWIQKVHQTFIKTRCEEDDVDVSL